MNLEVKQRQFSDELVSIGTSFRKGEITLEQYLQKRKQLVKQYRFDKGSEYFRK